jgi:hypothetical protein
MIQKKEICSDLSAKLLKEPFGVGWIETDDKTCVFQYTT